MSSRNTIMELKQHLRLQLRQIRNNHLVSCGMYGVQARSPPSPKAISRMQEANGVGRVSEPRIMVVSSFNTVAKRWGNWRGWRSRRKVLDLDGSSDRRCEERMAAQGISHVVSARDVLPLEGQELAQELRPSDLLGCEVGLGLQVG